MDEKLKKNVFHLGILLILIVVLIFTLVFTGILSCGQIPGGCEIYYTIIKGDGQPVVLIAYGEGGIGDSQKLEAVLAGREVLNARVKTMNMDRLTYGNVTEYQMIIVEGARKICTDKLKVFMYYVNAGGRLVWTGDAGTQLCDGTAGTPLDTYLKDKERNEGGKDQIIGPWARKDGDKQVGFDEFLGIDYIGNRCEFSECRKGEVAGYIQSVKGDHKLVYGLSPSFPYSGDFGIVKLRNESDVRLVAALDYGTSFLVQAKGTAGKPWIEEGKNYSLGQKLPFIVSSGVGDRVAYYAAPIESFVSEEQPQKNRAIVEQLYYGMLYK